MGDMHYKDHLGSIVSMVLYPGPRFYLVLYDLSCHKITLISFQLYHKMLLNTNPVEHYQIPKS